MEFFRNFYRFEIFKRSSYRLCWIKTFDFGREKGHFYTHTLNLDFFSENKIFKNFGGSPKVNGGMKSIFSIYHERHVQYLSFHGSPVKKCLL